MVGGGGWGGVPKSEFSTQCPRFTGEVSVPLAVTFRMLACHQATTHTISRQCYSAHSFSGDIGHAIMVSESAVDEGEIRLDEIAGRQVLRQ